MVFCGKVPGASGACRRAASGGVCGACAETPRVNNRSEAAQRATPSEKTRCRGREKCVRMKTPGARDAYARVRMGSRRLGAIEISVARKAVPVTGLSPAEFPEREEPQAPREASGDFEAPRLLVACGFDCGRSRRKAWRRALRRTALRLRRPSGSPGSR